MLEITRAQNQSEKFCPTNEWKRTPGRAKNERKKKRKNISS